MITLTRGDIVEADAEALVNTVNCVGFMGRGIALQFRRAFPSNFVAYEAACRQGAVIPGRMLVHETGWLTGPKFIINFPTKRHWRARSRIEDIESGLAALVGEVKRLEIRSIAVPPLGCGLGGLDWADVRPRIETAFRPLEDVDVHLFEPSGPPPIKSMSRSSVAPELTPGRATLIGLIERYLSALMDPSVSLLEVHKLMYFMQEAGEDLRLRYVKAPFGPYADNLRHVLARIEGHFVSGYADGGDAPDKQLAIVPGATHDASVFLDDHPRTRERFERVATLVSGFETPFGMELLASVHWLAAHEGVGSSQEAASALHAWSPTKSKFSSNHVEVAWQALVINGWLPGGATVEGAVQPR